MPRILLLALGLACGLTTVHSQTPEKGLLVMRAYSVAIDSSGNVTNKAPIVWEFKVMNIKTREWFSQPGYAPMVQEVPAGIYCLLSVSSYVNAEAKYCDEPYFAVAAGKINNAGLWSLGINYQTGQVKLLRSMEVPDHVLQQTVPADAELLRKYGATVRE